MRIMPSDAPHLETARADRPARLASCLLRAQSGELAALDEVVRELNPLLWHVARAQGLATEEAVDVVQTAWLELIRRLRDIRSPQALTAWLISTTRREAWHTKARLRKLPQESTETLDAAADPLADPSEQVVANERRQALLANLRLLSPRCRALMRIVAQVDRPDYSILAEALDMPRGSIGPTRGRCLAKLRELLLADPTWSAK